MQTYQKGQRVQLHPATDAWMRGDRYGQIVHVSQRGDICRYHVLMDKSNKTLRVAADDILEAIE